MIRIQVPATSANLGSGFDALGIALTLYNQVWMEESDTLQIVSRDATPVPQDEHNLVYWAAKLLYERCGHSPRGLHIEQENNIPMARGLGSSSACIVAGLLGANHLLGNPLGQQQLIDFAAEIEGHPDNTTPALLGGLVTSAMEQGRVYSVSVPVSEKIRFAVFVPPFELKTETARSVLPKEYSREDAVYNLSRSALMTASLFSGNLENLRVAVQDRIHQPYRKGLIDHCDKVFEICAALGSLGTYISGAGSTIIAMVEAGQAEDFAKQARAHMAQWGVADWEISIRSAEAHGARVFEETNS